MKTIIKRVAFLLVCVTLLLCLAACAQAPEEGIPDGMQIASYAGADYRLYVPTSWVLNTTYGISGAYRVLSQQSTVSVQRYDVAEWTVEIEAAIAANGGDVHASGERIAWFWNNACLASVKAHALDGNVTVEQEETAATVLGEKNAMRYHIHGLIDGDVRETLHFLQVVTEHNGGFYVFTFTANAEMYQLYLPDVEQMLEAFIFAEPYVPLDYAKHLDKGEDAPEGMIPAFGDDVAYCFYVPNTWKIRMDDSIYSAHVEILDETTGTYDRTSVSVVPYLPQNQTGEMSVAAYFEENKRMMEQMGGAGGFELISTTEKMNLGGRQATVYEYRFRVGGETYHYRQYIVAYKSMIYSLTYTSTEAYFEAHLAELDSIVNAFAFR